MMNPSLRRTAAVGDVADRTNSSWVASAERKGLSSYRRRDQSIHVDDL